MELAPTATTSPLRRFGPLLLLALFIIVGAWYFLGNGRPTDYVIPGVPAVTIFNHTGQNAYIISDPAATILSVLSYYGEEFTEGELQALNSAFVDTADPSHLYSMADVAAYVQGLGYETEYRTLSTPDEIQQYINAETRVPLIFFHNLTLDQPDEIPFAPYGVLIGVLEGSGEYVVHDYFFGYGKKLSFENFEALRRSADSGQAYTYLIIHPKDGEYKKKEAGPYPARTAAMERAEPIIHKITLARVAAHQDPSRYEEVAMPLLVEAVDDPDFETVVPPYYKVLALGGIAVGEHFFRADRSAAEVFTVRAEALNHDLDQPFGDYWPGFEDKTKGIPGIVDTPYYMRGVFLGLDERYEEAIVSLETALTFWPYSEPVHSALEEVRRLQSAGQ